MTKLQKVGYWAIAFITMSSQTFAAINFLTWPIKDDIKWSWENADGAIQGLLKNVLWFLWLLAVLLAIYWGFMILTAAWDDGKVKKWKTVLVQALMWLLVIFLAYSIVNWLLDAIF